ncbi:hypothetical protein [Microvirga arsenatis]|uniref:Uncharacterized protein n=1 Tax=Microvirga arsenatis TaxID=2692265 RepID=A0ABW9Z3A2_9HYPH|nr:hypothetical protein [Microvirga arsenatis]NBJ12577.1 hypothetical protein [Microvirga arsenatis]NBJ26185.1 hypothetical protein [Microvirga arsenatis]
MRYYELVEGKPTQPKTGITKPLSPMSPEKSRREAERKAGINQEIRDEQAQSSQKVQGLRAKLARKA